MAARFSNSGAHLKETQIGRLSSLLRLKVDFSADEEQAQNWLVLGKHQEDRQNSPGDALNPILKHIYFRSFGGC